MQDGHRAESKERGAWVSRSQRLPGRKGSNGMDRRGLRSAPYHTSEWKKHAADLEAEMLKRGMMFDVIDWSEDQGSLPFER
jgi:hypothetical protein